MLNASRLNKPEIKEGGLRTRPLSDAESRAVRADFMAHDGQCTRAKKMLEKSLKDNPTSTIAYGDALTFFLVQPGPDKNFSNDKRVKTDLEREVVA